MGVDNVEFSLNTKFGIIIFILCVALVVVFALYGNIYRTTTIQCNEYYHKWIKQNCMEYKETVFNITLYDNLKDFGKDLNISNTS